MPLRVKYTEQPKGYYTKERETDYSERFLVP